jgi:hypothetical protein
VVGFLKGRGGMGRYLISLNTELIILCSACRIAKSRPFASHSHWASAGWEQIAQSGSMILTGFLDLECLINMISGRRYSIKNIKKNTSVELKVVAAPLSEKKWGEKNKRGLEGKGVLCMIREPMMEFE